jgi:hypothetical protein
MALQLHIVYGITQHKYNSVAYIGSSKRDSQRESEHTNLASGARRVVTTFAQKWHQPVNEHFETNTLWMGECTPAQAKSIEQVFMDRHETRIFPRPTNGVTVDIDLLQPPTGRLQLNVVRSCTDPELIDWAEKRIFNDTALAEAPSARDMAVAHHLVEMEMLSLTEAVDDTASTVVERAIAKFGGFDPDEPVSVTDFHSTLNEVLGTLCDDDGADARSAVLSKVAYFNADKRGSGFTCRAAMVEAEFAALRVALGHNKRKTESGSETGEKKQRAVDAPDTRAVNPMQPSTYLMPYTPSWEIHTTVGDQEWTKCLMCNMIIGPYLRDKDVRGGKRKNHKNKGAGSGCQHPDSPNMLKVRVGRGFADVRRRENKASGEAWTQAAEPRVEEEVTVATESKLVPTQPSMYPMPYSPSWEIHSTVGDQEWSRCLMCNMVVGPYQKNSEVRASKRKNHRFKGAANGCQHPDSPNMLKERVGRGFASTQRRLTM